MTSFDKPQSHNENVTFADTPCKDRYGLPHALSADLINLWELKCWWAGHAQQLVGERPPPNPMNAKGWRDDTRAKSRRSLQRGTTFRCSRRHEGHGSITGRASRSASARTESRRT